MIKPLSVSCDLTALSLINAIIDLFELPDIKNHYLSSTEENRFNFEVTLFSSSELGIELISFVTQEIELMLPIHCELSWVRMELGDSWFVKNRDHILYSEGAV